MWSSRQPIGPLAARTGRRLNPLEVGGGVHASGRAEGGQAVCFLSGQLCGVGCEGQLRIKRQKKADGLLGLSVNLECLKCGAGRSPAPRFRWSYSGASAASCSLAFLFLPRGAESSSKLMEPFLSASSLANCLSAMSGFLCVALNSSKLTDPFLSASSLSNCFCGFGPFLGASSAWQRAEPMSVRLTVKAVARVVLIFIWFVFVVYFGERECVHSTGFDFRSVKCRRQSFS